MFSFTSFRRTDRLGVLQYSIFSPTDYRFSDAINLKDYIDYQNQLEQDSDSSDYFDDESTAYYSSSLQPLSGNFRYYSPVEIHAKSSIVCHLVDPVSIKQNKLICDVFI